MSSWYRILSVKVSGSRETRSRTSSLSHSALLIIASIATAFAWDPADRCLGRGGDGMPITYTGGVPLILPIVVGLSSGSLGGPAG